MSRGSYELRAVRRRIDLRKTTVGARKPGQGKRTKGHVVKTIAQEADVSALTSVVSTMLHS